MGGDAAERSGRDAELPPWGSSGLEGAGDAPLGPWGGMLHAGHSHGRLPIALRRLRVSALKLGATEIHTGLGKKKK